MSSLPVGPGKMPPTTTIFPSGWTTAADPRSLKPKSMVVEPSPAKPGSGVPSDSSRATAKSSPLPDGWTIRAPATTIFPSGWITTESA